MCQDLTGEKSSSALWIAQPCGAPSNNRLEQPPSAPSCAKGFSRTEADPRAEAASHPNALFDWTQQTRHLCCVPQPSSQPGDLLVCIPSVLYSDLSLPWSDSQGLSEQNDLEKRRESLPVKNLGLFNLQGLLSQFCLCVALSFPRFMQKICRIFEAGPMSPI